MFRKILPAAFLFCGLAMRVLAEAPAPQVGSISPSSGSTRGGNEVIIAGANLSLPDGFACILGCPTVVRFGDIDVDATHESNARVTVTAPAHAAGTVDVTVRTGDGRQTTVTAGYTFTTAAQAGYEMLLLPVYTDGKVSGQKGSEWETTLWLHNAGDADVQLAPWVCEPPGSGCPAVFPLTKILKAHESLRGLPAFFRPPTANPGRLLYVTRDSAIAANLRLADTSRRGTDGGTEIPVVRERSLRTGSVNLLNVPLAANSRILVRIYDTALARASFRVTVFAQTEGKPEAKLSEQTLDATTSETGDFRLQPAYAQLAGLESVLDLPVILPDALRIEIAPLTPGSAFWAFASVTNNDTQHVTLVTP